MPHARIGQSLYVPQPPETAEERYFRPYRENMIGSDDYFETPFGRKKLLYADWTASGRLYRPIEQRMAEEIGPYVANTHSEASYTGKIMTRAYASAKQIIKEHVHASENDIVLLTGTGMTGAVNKLQRLLGLRVPKQWSGLLRLPPEKRPVVFVTHMEHHSNLITWAETICDVVTVPPGTDGLVEPVHLERLLKIYRCRPLLIGAFTACSNVTGFETPIPDLARIMHQSGGLCIADYAASAPYAKIHMHPLDPLERLDAVLFSPHKFLGGPGTSGVLVMNGGLLHHPVPDEPGGGTVNWTDPWGGFIYKKEPEAREDGGTPGFLQAIRTALCIRLKEEMGVSRLLSRDRMLASRLLNHLRKVPGLTILGGADRERLGIVSFYTHHIHYNLMVRMLSDRFGIQARGGCSCAGPYGHHLLGINQESSAQISQLIEAGDFIAKPGWVRISLHPVMTEAEIDFIASAVQLIIENARYWKQDYVYQAKTNEWTPVWGEGKAVSADFYRPFLPA